MAAKKSVLDTYANMAAVTATPSVADEFAATKFAFPFSIMDKIGLLVSRIEYFLNAIGSLNSATDYIYTGLASAATLVDPGEPSDSLIIDSIRVIRTDLGAAASGVLVDFPLVRDFSTLPGGGLLVAPAPLYLWTKSSGAAAVMPVQCRLWYTYMELAADEYWQLVESRRVISS